MKVPLEKFIDLELMNTYLSCKHLCSSYYMAATVLSALQILTHLILTSTL